MAAEGKEPYLGTVRTILTSAQTFGFSVHSDNPLGETGFYVANTAENASIIKTVMQAVELKRMVRVYYYDDHKATAVQTWDNVADAAPVAGGRFTKLPEVSLGHAPYRNYKAGAWERNSGRFHLFGKEGLCSYGFHGGDEDEYFAKLEFVSSSVVTVRMPQVLVVPPLNPHPPKEPMPIDGWVYRAEAHRGAPGRGSTGILAESRSRVTTSVFRGESRARTKIAGRFSGGRWRLCGPRASRSWPIDDAGGRATALKDATPTGQMTLTPADGTHEKAKSSFKVTATATAKVPASATESYRFVLTLSVAENGNRTYADVLPGHCTEFGTTLDVDTPDNGIVEARS